jgi:methylenetetrahydrofolate--tRNA-(uracil-5-)-methyltransferase
VTGERFFAVAQLRQEDAAGRMWSLVGFQTGVKWGDQQAVVRLIPGLEEAEVVRFGVMHRNTYLCAPRLLDAHLALRVRPDVFVSGVLAGTEGYLESSATGWLAGTNAARRALGLAADGAARGQHARRAGAVPGDRQPRRLPADERELGPGAGRRRRRGGPGKRERRELAYERGLDAFTSWLEELRVAAR